LVVFNLLIVKREILKISRIYLSVIAIHSISFVFLMKKLIIFLWLFGLNCIVANAQLTIIVKSVPVSTKDDDKIFISGTMNGWNPAHPSFQLYKNSEGFYTITFTPVSRDLKFKFTKGSWDKGEVTSTGSFVENREATYEGRAKTLTFNIDGWDNKLVDTFSTASGRVSILSDSFYMPHLHKKRKIWLYLPKDYSVSSKYYPVLYMHDGQNLFDKRTSYSGEWMVDESLDSLFSEGDYGCIVVGIENGQQDRLHEYSPWIHPTYGGGQGDEYIDFIVKTLKPYIDNHYRTKKGKDHTGIMGSSMGGLISLYAGIAYPEIFGRVGAFSASYWFSDEAFSQVSHTGVQGSSYVYMIAGLQEGATQVEDMDKMYSELIAAGGDSMHVVKRAHPDGKHTESYWAREFPAAYKWLFSTKIKNDSNKQKASFKVNFDGVKLRFIGKQPMAGKYMYLLDSKGKQIFTSKIDNNLTVTLPKDSTLRGKYYVKVQNKLVSLNLHYPK
jgi:predicted alpha/beta superfamily hydrolase